MNLVELLVTLTIISILAGVSMNTYRKFTIETSRSEAKTALAQAQVWVERYLIENNTAQLPTLPVDLNTTNYALSLNQTSNTDASNGLYYLQATAISSSAQNNDEKNCKTLKLYQNGVKQDGNGTVNSCW